MVKEKQHMIQVPTCLRGPTRTAHRAISGKSGLYRRQTGARSESLRRITFGRRIGAPLNDPGGVRNLIVENLLAYIETGYGEVFGHVMAGTPLTQRDREIMAHFTAAMIVRTETMVGMMKDTFTELHRQAAKIEAAENIEPSLSEALRIRLPDVRGTSVAVGIEEYSKALFLHAPFYIRYRR